MISRYVGVFELIGLSPPDKEVILEASEFTRSAIHPGLHAIPSRADEAAAVAHLLLTGLGGTRDGKTPEDRIAEEVNNIRVNRISNLAGKSAILVVEERRAVGDFVPEAQRDYGAFEVGIGNSPKAEITSSGRSAGERAIGALSATIPGLASVKPVIEVSYFERESGKPFYCFNLAVSANLVVWSSGNSQDWDGVRRLIGFLSKDRTVAESAKLLGRALLEREDTLFCFLLAWTSLEMLINKSFPKDEEKFLAELKSGNVLPIRVVDRIGAVMGEKYRLNDKFSLHVHGIELEEAKRLELEFAEIKKVRDEFMHNPKFPKDQLPTERLLRLIQQIIYLDSGNGDA